MRTIHRDIAGVFIFSKDNKVLLGRAGVYKGKLVIPGGGIDKGEAHEEAAKREVLEETGINLSHYSIEKIPGDNSGKSEKVLRDTGEKVIVEMDFYDYKVKLEESAAEIVINAQDDYYSAKFYAADDLTDEAVGSATKTRLIQIGFLNDSNQ